MISGVDSQPTSLQQTEARQRKFQLSLASVLVLMLMLCPAFIAIRHVVNVANGRERGWTFGEIPFAVVYALALTFITYRRREIATSYRPYRALLWCVVSGAVFGMLYFVLLFESVVIAEWIFVDARRPSMILETLLVGIFLGAPGGAIVWVLMRLFPRLEGKSRARNLGGASATQLSFNPDPTKFSELDMETLFSKRAQDAMQLVEAEARKIDHEYIGTEHLLLGLLSDGSLAATVLRNLNVAVESVRDEIKGLWPPSTGQLSPVRQELALPFTPAAKRAFDQAFDEAQPLKEGGRRIDAGDLLIGLFREQDGVAAQILLNHGLSLEQLRSEIERVNRSPS
jgi:hypothetical protein